MDTADLAFSVDEIGGGSMVFVAGRDAFTVEGAVELLTSYEARFGATVLHYDLDGPNEIDMNDGVSQPILDAWC